MGGDSFAPRVRSCFCLRVVCDRTVPLGFFSQYLERAKGVDVAARWLEDSAG